MQNANNVDVGHDMAGDRRQCHHHGLFNQCADQAVQELSENGNNKSLPSLEGKLGLLCCTCVNGKLPVIMYCKISTPADSPLGSD